MERITDSASQMFDFVNQSMSWRTATLTAGGIALLAYHNEKRERRARAGNPSLMKVRIPAIQPSLRQERRLSRALRTSAPTGGIRKRSSGDASSMRSSPVRLSAQYRRADGKPCYPISRPKPLPKKKNARLAKFLDAVTGALKEYLGYESLPEESTKKPKRVLVDSGFTPAPGSLFGPTKPQLPSPIAVDSKPTGPVAPNFDPFGPKLKSDYEANIFGAKPDPPKSTWGPKVPDTQSPFTFESQSSKPEYLKYVPTCAGYTACLGDKSFEDSCYGNVCRYPRLNSESMSFGSTKVNVSDNQTEPRVPDSQSLFARDPFYTNRCFLGHVTGQQDTANAESTFKFGSADLKPCENPFRPRPSPQPTPFSKEPEAPEAPVSQFTPQCKRYAKYGVSPRAQQIRAEKLQARQRRTSRAQKTLGFPATRTVDPQKKMFGAVAPGDEHARAALKDKIEHYQNSTVCDEEMTVQNTHQPWRLVSAYHVVRLIPFDAHPDDAELFFPYHFHTTYNVVAWVLQRLGNEVMTDYDLVTMLMKFGSDLKDKLVDVEYMVSYDHPSEWDEMQRDYWRAIEQLKAHTIPTLGVERRGDVLVTAGEEYFEEMGWEMKMPKWLKEALAKRRREQAGTGSSQVGMGRDQVRTRRDQPVISRDQSGTKGDWSGLGGSGSRWFT